MTNYSEENSTLRVKAGEPILDILPYEGSPLRLFAFINVDDPVVAWASYRGILVSANAEFSQPNCPVSMMFAGIINTQNNARLNNELLIEETRQRHFPQCNSRLTGMYFFENLKSASLVYEWGGHFSSEYLAEVLLFPTAPISRHDANWITHASLDKRGRIKKTDWISKYWSGEPFPNREPIWEIIAQGRATICGSDIRIRAYNCVYSKLLNAVALLEIGRIAAHIGSDLGQMSAWLINNDDKNISLTFHLDMRDADESTFLEKIANYSGPRNYADLAVGGDYFGLPHFDEVSFQFKVTNNFLSSVHRNS